jgi:hypothetical protein
MKTETPVKTDNEVDGYHVVEEFLLTKGEQIVNSEMHIPFKPLVDFALILYSKKANATNRLAMKFDLERFFMRRCAGELRGVDFKEVKVPTEIFQKVKSINDQYRNGKTIED